MENSLKGTLITITLALIFITCILNFIVLFPEEQGVTFGGENQNTYLTISRNNDTGAVSTLTALDNQTSSSFNQWDVTTGFMGSNSMKQGQTGVISGAKKIFSSLKVITLEVFKNNEAVAYILSTLGTLAGIILIYTIYQFVRTGR